MHDRDMTQHKQQLFSLYMKGTLLSDSGRLRRDIIIQSVSPANHQPSTSLLLKLPGSYKMPTTRAGSLTIGGEEEVCSVLLRQPSDLIDLLLDLQTLKVVELGLMALEGAVDIVLSLGEGLRLALWKEKEVHGHREQE